MASPKLPSTNSIVDYLRSRGIDSSQRNRRKLYKESGLEKRMGSYQFTGSQNLALLDYMRNQKPTTQNPSFFQGEAPPNAFEARDNNPPSFFRGDAPPNAFEARDAAYKTSPELTRMSVQNSPKPPETPYQTSPELTRFSQNAASITPSIGGDTISAPTGNERPAPSPAPTAPSSDLASRFPSYLRVTDALTSDSVDAKMEQRGFSSPASAPAPTTSAPQFDVTGVNSIDSGIGKLNEEMAQFARFGMPIPPEWVAGKLTEIKSQLEQIQNPMDRNAAEQTVTGQVDAAVASATGGVSGSTVAGADASVSEIDLINQWLNSTEGQLAMERAELDGLTAEQKNEVAKQALDQKYEQELSALNERLAANGLAFSGIRGSQVKALADSLATSKLAADREFASKLLDADLNFRETILDGVASLISAAEKDDDDAIKQLNLAGYAVVGGELIPTLSMLKEQRIAEVDNLVIQTNSAGQVSAIDKATGETVWRTGSGVGRSGTSSPNLSVTPIADPATGAASYVQVVDRDSGNVEFRDISTGEMVSPDQVQIDDAADPLDAFINSVIAESIGNVATQ